MPGCKAHPTLAAASVSLVQPALLTVDSPESPINLRISVLLAPRNKKFKLVHKDQIKSWAPWDIGNAELASLGFELRGFPSYPPLGVDSISLTSSTAVRPTSQLKQGNEP